VAARVHQGRLRRFAAVAAAALAVVPGAAAAGSFSSSDAQLDAIWAASVRTADDMVSRPVRLLPGCGVPKGEQVILDGVVRDRCEFTGDLAVTGLALEVSEGAVKTPIRAILFLFASRQRADGLVPDIPGQQGPGLVDYTAYWIEDVYDYVLYSGDVAAARSLYVHLVRALDEWYPAQMRDGLMADLLPARADYAGIDRRDPYVAYYNAQYVRALELGAALARWSGHGADARRWSRRAARLAPVVNRTFWDPGARAYKDTVGGPLVHPQDGNAFVVLAGVATRRQAVSALGYLDAHNQYGYGNSIADNDVWDGFPWGDHASMRVYPFMSYFEVVARFRTGLDATALNLIRREWGYMLANGPRTTMWETIAPYGGGPVHGSWDHGWSSGAAPVLTNYVLGVRPTSPGFRTFVVTPHTGGLAWAKGVVPTPHGNLRVAWHYGAQGRVAIEVHAPPGTRWVHR
jgi:hypothetical protein